MAGSRERADDAFARVPLAAAVEFAHRELAITQRLVGARCHHGAIDHWQASSACARLVSCVRLGFFGLLARPFFLV